jgi:CBS domain containing-hemolysin-like protein
VDEHGLLTGALELGERRAGDVMVPLEGLVTVPLGSTPAQVEAAVARTGFSRFPVVGPPSSPKVTAAVPTSGPGGTLRDGVAAVTAGADDLVGYLHVKDLLYADDDRHDAPVPQTRVRSLAAVAREDHVEDALTAMQRSGAHLARVVGDDGRTLGVVFLEDVLEELVGEVRDATQLAKVQVKRA